MGDSNEPHSQCGTKRTCLRGNGRNIFGGFQLGSHCSRVQMFYYFTVLIHKMRYSNDVKTPSSYLSSFFLVLRTILIEFVLNLRKFLSPLAWKSSSDSSGHFYVFLSFSSPLPTCNDRFLLRVVKDFRTTASPKCILEFLQEESKSIICTLGKVTIIL